MLIALQICRPVSSGLVAELAGEHAAATVSAAVFELQIMISSCINASPGIVLG